MKSIHVRGLTFGYSPEQPIFERFSWTAGSRVVILEGPSGCGKTTLLRLLAGQLIGMNPATEWAVPYPAKIILQDEGLFPWLTAAGNLALVPEWAGFDRLHASLEPIAAVVRLYADRMAGTLSFGQRRLLEVLRILAFPTPLVLLDEPLNFLDTARRLMVIAAIDQLARTDAMFVISSHYETDFARLRCERYRFEGDLPYGGLARHGDDR